MMGFVKKATAVAVSGLMAVAMLAGCQTKSSTGNTSGKVTLTFWHTYSDTEVKVFNEKIIPDFEKTHKNITIKSVTYPTSNFKQQVIQAVAGKSGPDVLRADVTWVPQLASLGGLYEVGSRNGFNDIKSSSFASALSTCEWNGKYYGVPDDTNTKIAIYNTSDLKDAGLSEAPKSFDELLSAAKTLKAKHPNGLIAIGGTAVWSMGPYFLSLGGQYSNSKYTKASGYINSDKSVAALQKLLDAYDQGLIGKCILGGQPGTWDGLKADNGYAMIDDGPWFFSLQDKTITSKYTQALIPSGDGGSVSLVGGEDLVMTKSSKNQEAAWEFMKYLSSSEFPQKTMALEADCIPTYTPVATSSAVTSDPVMKVYVEQLKTAWARIPNQHFEEMDDDINKAFESAFRHKGTAKEILDGLAKQLDTLFANSSAYTASSASSGS